MSLLANGVAVPSGYNMSNFTNNVLSGAVGGGDPRSVLAAGGAAAPSAVQLQPIAASAGSTMNNTYTIAPTVVPGNNLTSNIFHSLATLQAGGFGPFSAQNAGAYGANLSAVADPSVYGPTFVPGTQLPRTTSTDSAAALALTRPGVAAASPYAVAPCNGTLSGPVTHGQTVQTTCGGPIMPCTSSLVWPQPYPTNGVGQVAFQNAVRFSGVSTGVPLMDVDSAGLASAPPNGFKGLWYATPVPWTNTTSCACPSATSGCGGYLPCVTNQPYTF